MRRRSRFRLPVVLVRLSFLSLRLVVPVRRLFLSRLRGVLVLGVRRSFPSRRLVDREDSRLDRRGGFLGRIGGDVVV